MRLDVVRAAARGRNGPCVMPSRSAPVLGLARAPVFALGPHALFPVLEVALEGLHRQGGARRMSRAGSLRGCATASGHDTKKWTLSVGMFML